MSCLCIQALRYLGFERVYACVSSLIGDRVHFWYCTALISVRLPMTGTFISMKRYILLQVVHSRTLQKRQKGIQYAGKKKKNHKHGTLCFWRKKQKTRAIQEHKRGRSAKNREVTCNFSDDTLLFLADHCASAPSKTDTKPNKMQANQRKTKS